MPLTSEDIARIAELLRPLEQRMDKLERKFDHDFAELRERLSSFEILVNTQFNEVQNNFDALFARDEKREQEYLVLRGQIARLEDRVQILEEKVA